MSRLPYIEADTRTCLVYGEHRSDRRQIKQDENKVYL